MPTTPPSHEVLPDSSLPRQDLAARRLKVRRAPRAVRYLSVGIQGADFTSVQAAVDAAWPGDTVVIRGGVYREPVVSCRGGEPGRPITVRSAPNQEVLIMPGLPLAGRPEPVDGLPDVYRWPSAGLRSAIEADQAGFWEAPTHLRLKRVYALEECENRLASWYYDAVSDALFLRSSGAAPACDLIYMREEAEHPVFSVRHSRLQLENLILAFGAFGVHVDGTAEQVTVRGCRAYCNRSAGIYVSGDHHLIEDNELFHNNQYGIQLRHSVNHTRVLRNRTFFNGPNNGERTDSSVPADLSMYSQGVYNLFEGNVVDGLHQNAFRIKFGGNNANVFRHNVVRGFFDCAAPCIANNTLIVNGLGPRFGGYVNRVVADANPDPERVDPGGRQRRTNIIHPAIHKEDPRFADPAWRDYRLQADSPCRGMGAHPGGASILYVDPAAGDDSHHGQSVIAAFKTLAHALSVVHPGYTVYLMPGVHAETLRLTLGGLSASDPLRIRAYGQSAQVVLTGGVVVERKGGTDDEVAFADKPFLKIGPAHIVFEGLTFKGRGVQVKDASDIRFSHCVWDGPETALDIAVCAGVRVDHATMAGSGGGVVVRESPNTTISRSLFSGAAASIDCDTNSAATLQAYYNAYARPEWQMAERKLTALEAWQAAVSGACGERVQAIALLEGYALPMFSPLLSAADDFGFLGARPAPAADRLEIRDLRAAGLTPQSATLLWETPCGSTESSVRLRRLDDGVERTLTPVSTFQIWGEYFDMSFRTEAFFMADRHASLDGLKPGMRYEVEVTATSADGTARNVKAIRLQTPAALPDARVFYVSPTGSDTADGSAPEKAWQSLRKASAQAAPGDCVRVLPGLYRETLRPRISGTAGHPVVFESTEPQGAILDLMESLPAGIEVLNVDQVHIRGFAIANGMFARGNAIVIANGRGLQISGCQVLYPKGSSFEKLRLAHAGLVAADAPDLLVENNVFLCGAYGIGLGRCPGARVLNNTILGEGNYGVAIVPDRPEEVYTVKNNIFERPVMGYKTGSALWMFNVRARLESDCNLFHIPATFNGTVGMMIDRRHKSLADWQGATGLDRHSIKGQPRFVNPEAGDFRLADGSPGKNSAEDGGPIGIRQ